MNSVIRSGILIATLGVAFVVAPSPLLAQSGSTGGSIGNVEKSLSGTRSAPSPDREAPRPRSRKAEAPRRASRGGGGGSFDGTWAYTGVGTNCQGSGTGTFVVSGGIVTGKGGSSGRISPAGAYQSSAIGEDGVALTATGHMSGNAGSGTYRRADGCMGNWTAAKM